MIYPAQLTNFIVTSNQSSGSAALFCFAEGMCRESPFSPQTAELLIFWISAPADELSAMLTCISFSFLYFSDTCCMPLESKKYCWNSYSQCWSICFFDYHPNCQRNEMALLCSTALRSSWFHTVLCFLDRQKLFLFFLMNALCVMLNSSW